MVRGSSALKVQLLQEASVVPEPQAKSTKCCRQLVWQGQTAASQRRTACRCAQAHSAPMEKVTMEYRWLRTKKQVHWAPPGSLPVTMSVYADPGTHTSSGQCYTAQAGHSLAKASPRWKPASPNQTVTLFTAALNGTEVLRLFLQDPKKWTKGVEFYLLWSADTSWSKAWHKSTTTILSRKNKQRIQGRQ